MRTLRLLAPVFVLFASCAMPSSASLDRPADRHTDPSGQPDVPATPITGTRESTEIHRLREAGDDKQLLAFVEAALDDRRSRSASERAWLHLVRAEALESLGRNFSALTSFGRAWAEMKPSPEGLGNDILVQWGDAEIRLGEPEEAIVHYELALEAKGLERAREQRLLGSLVVANEMIGHDRDADAYRSQLDRRGVDSLVMVRARLLTKVRRQRVADLGPKRPLALPPGVIPTDPSQLLAGTRTRSEWGARPIRADHVPMTPITSITVHHSAMPPPTSMGTVAQLRQIQNVHTNDRGWADVGYHFLIDPSGRVWEGRKLLHQGAHAGGAANIGNIGICLLGNFDNQDVPRAQLKALDRLVEGLRSHFAIARSDVRTHREWKATSCPGSHLHEAVVAYRSGRRSTLALQ